MKKKYYLLPFIFLLFISCTNSSDNKNSNLKLKYLGAAGWEISEQETTVLIDPYLSRIKLVGNSTTKTVATSALNRDWGDDNRQKYFRDDYFSPDTSVINSHITKADYIFILPWNLKDEITNQIRENINYDVNFVIAIPKLEIY